eukprot:scaffold7506_cov376-Prasinococcus_capsulatus_cf.AAC.1
MPTAARVGGCTRAAGCPAGRKRRAPARPLTGVVAVGGERLPGARGHAQPELHGRAADGGGAVVLQLARIIGLQGGQSPSATRTYRAGGEGPTLAPATPTTTG